MNVAMIGISDNTATYSVIGSVINSWMGSVTSFRVLVSVVSMATSQQHQLFVFHCRSI